MSFVTALRFISVFIIFAIALWLQTHAIISGDITWLMHVGQRFKDTTILKKVPAPDLLGFFLQDKQFVKFWLDYQYKGQSGDFTIYQLKTS